MIKDGKLVWLPAVHKQSVYFVFSIFLCNICTVLVLNIFQLCWEYSICSHSFFCKWELLWSVNSLFDCSLLFLLVRICSSILLLTGSVSANILYFVYIYASTPSVHMAGGIMFSDCVSVCM